MMGIRLVRFAKCAGAAVILATLSAWVLIPPFPSPEIAVNDSFATLTEKLGPPVGSIPTKFVAWQRSRGVAVWSLQAEYRSAPFRKACLVAYGQLGRHFNFLSVHFAQRRLLISSLGARGDTGRCGKAGRGFAPGWFGEGGWLRSPL